MSNFFWNIYRKVVKTVGSKIQSMEENIEMHWLNGVFMYGVVCDELMKS